MLDTLLDWLRRPARALFDVFGSGMPMVPDEALVATVHGTAVEHWDVKLKAQQGGTMASLWHGDQLVAAARGDTPDEALQALKRLRDPSVVPLAARVVRR